MGDWWPIVAETHRCALYKNGAAQPGWIAYAGLGWHTTNGGSRWRWLAVAKAMWNSMIYRLNNKWSPERRQFNRFWWC